MQIYNFFIFLPCHKAAFFTLYYINLRLHIVYTCGCVPSYNII